jgi:hypothetical protein
MSGRVELVSDSVTTVTSHDFLPLRVVPARRWSKSFIDRRDQRRAGSMPPSSCAPFKARRFATGSHPMDIRADS